MKNLHKEGADFNVSPPLLFNQLMGTVLSVVGDLDEIRIADTVDNNQSGSSRQRIVDDQVMKSRIGDDDFVFEKVVIQRRQLLDDLSGGQAWVNLSADVA